MRGEYILARCSQSQANYSADSGNSYGLNGAADNYRPTYASGAYPYPSPVGSFAVNGYGLYDMAGNVWQWCWDWYGTTVAGSALKGASSGSYRVLRGGLWYYSAAIARSACRSPAGSFAANGFGLYDMAGNVSQWCWDRYGTSYSGGSDPRGAATGSARVLRGGSWLTGWDGLRCARRNGYGPDSADSGVGFRVARGPEAERAQ